MRRKLIYGTLVPLFSIAILLNCNPSNKYAVKQFIEVKPDVYMCTFKGYTPSISKSEQLSNKTPICFINGNDIPYISIKTGVDVLYSNVYHVIKPQICGDYSYETKDNKTVIKNNVNNSTCVIDYNNQTMEFNDHNAFTNNDVDQKNPLDDLFTEGRQHFLNVKLEKYKEAESSYIIDFKKYNIPLFCKDNEGYIPNEVFNNILNPNPVINATYINNSLYIYSDNLDNLDQLKNKLTINKVINGSFSSKYMEYCYNLNALTLDVNFGQRVRESRAVAGHTIKYNIDGYSNMNKHGKNNFLSNDHNVANQALINTINNEYEDMGHTSYSNVGLLEDKVPDTNYGYETEFYVKTIKSLESERTSAGLDPVTTTEHSDAIGDFKVFDDTEHKKDTAFLTMDKFVRPDATKDYRTLDYWTNTLSLVYYADKQIRNNANIKNLVLDLSQNGGGVGFTALFMSSWLTKGQSHLKQCSFKNNTFSDISYQADINSDGQITELDFLPSNIENLYVIVTPASYSCGNLVPSDLKDYSTAKFIGNRSGGGCCSVRVNNQTGYGSTYPMSSHRVICRKDADENNLISNDNGVGVEKTGDIPISLETPALYYNRQAIYDAITK